MKNYILLFILAFSSLSLSATKISVDPAVRAAIRTQKTVEVLVKLSGRNHSFGQYPPSNSKNNKRAQVFSQNLNHALSTAATKANQSFSDIQVVSRASNIGVAQIIASSATIKALISLSLVDAIQLAQ